MMSVRLSVRHTRESHLNGLRYRSTFCIVQQSDDWHQIFWCWIQGFTTDQCVT